MPIVVSSQIDASQLDVIFYIGTIYILCAIYLNIIIHYSYILIQSYTYTA